RLRNKKEIRVPARNNQGHRWIFNRRIFKSDRVDVPFYVIDSDNRFAKRECHSLRIRDANEQRAYKSGTSRDSNSVNLFFLNMSALECLFNNGHDLIQMLARSKLRHNAAEALMNLYLLRDHDRNKHDTI